MIRADALKKFKLKGRNSLNNKGKKKEAGAYQVKKYIYTII